MRHYWLRVVKETASGTAAFVRQRILLNVILVIAGALIAYLWQMYTNQPLNPSSTTWSVALALAPLALVTLGNFVWNFFSLPPRIERGLRARISELEAATQKVALKDVLQIETDERPTRPAGKYLGLKCTNRSNQDIENCRIRLEVLAFWADSQNAWVAPDWFSPLLLAWSFNDGGGAMKTIGAYSNRTCDLVYYLSESTSQAVISAAENQLRLTNQIGFGKWLARCHVEADRYLPLNIEAEFIWEPRETPLGQLRSLHFLLIYIDLRVVALEGSS